MSDMSNEQTHQPATEHGDEPRRSTPGRLHALVARHPWLKIAGAIAAVFMVSAAAWWWWEQRAYQSTDDAQVDGYLYPISPRINGHILDVYVQDGQFVAAGTLLVAIDPRDYEVALAKARSDYATAESNASAAHFEVPVSEIGSTSQIRSAQAEVGTADAGVAAAQRQVEQARAELTRLKAAARTANADATRYATLVEKDEISRQQYDQTVAAAEAADAAVQAGEAAVQAAEQVARQATERVPRATAGLASARATTMSAKATNARAQSSAAQVESARAALQQAELNVSYTKIVAPADGVVGRRTAQAGQNVQPGQELLIVVPVKDLWVTANFKETQLTRMQAGQPVDLSVDACPHDLKGTVTAIGGATGARYSLLPPENATGNYVKVVQRIPVRIDLQRDQQDACLLRPGMSVVPSVKVR